MRVRDRVTAWGFLGSLLRLGSAGVVFYLGYALNPVGASVPQIRVGAGIGAVAVAVLISLLWDPVAGGLLAVLGGLFGGDAVEDLRWATWEVLLWLGMLGVVLLFPVVIVGIVSSVLLTGRWEFVNPFALVSAPEDPGVRFVVDLASTVLVLFLSILGTYVGLLGLKNRIYTVLMSGNTGRLIDELQAFLPGPRLVPDIRVTATRRPVFWYGSVDDGLEVTPVGRDEAGSGAAGSGEGENRLEPDPGEPNLVYVRIRYNDGDPEARQSLLRPVFPKLRWWIHFPDGYRVLRREDVAGEGPIHVDDTTISDEDLREELEAMEADLLDKPDEMAGDRRRGDEQSATGKVRIEDGPDGAGAYSNLAFGYSEAKGYVLTPNQTRGEVSYFGTGHNKRVHVPVWVVPRRRGDWHRTIRVAINAAEFPHYQIEREFRVSLPEDDDP